MEATSQITDETDNRDANHLVELTLIYAQEGNPSAGQILYDTFLKFINDEDTLGDSAIIELDKLDGFIYVVHQLVDNNLFDADDYVDSYLLVLLKDTIGEAVATEALAKARLKDEKLDLYLNLVEKYRSNRRAINLSEDIELTYEEVKYKIKNRIPFGIEQWGQNVSDEKLRRIANDFIQEDDPNLLLLYLRLFRRTPFPLSPELLFPLVDHSHFIVPTMTLGTLKIIQHPAVRAFAFQLIDEQRFIGRAVGLLTRNFEEADWEIIESLSHKVDEFDDETYHSFGISVQDIFSAHHPSQKAKQTLLNIYEYGPCSFCREAIIEMLQSINALSEQIRQECHYDSSNYIRALARNNFEKDSPI